MDKSKPFQFKQFTIHQDQCAMKVGTDGILLGAWASVDKAKRILDIGTGTGLLALMTAQRNPTAIIHAVEIDHAAYSQACENVSESPWHDRISVFHAPIQVFDGNPEKRYDFIISNPPFFNSDPSDDPSVRNVARSTLWLSFQELLENVVRLLAPGGVFSLVLPETEGRLFIEEGIDQDLFPFRITEVRPKEGKPMHRLLIELSGKSRAVEKNSLIIHPNGPTDYTEAYTALTREFYFNF